MSKDLNTLKRIIKYYKSPMSEILFKGGKVQTGYRIKIPKAVIDTLNLKIGQGIIIEFDSENRALKIKEDKKKK